MSKLGFPEQSPVWSYRKYIVGSLELVAPEKAEELRRSMENHGVRVFVDQDLEGLFSARITDGRRGIHCSIYGAELVWACSLAYHLIHDRFLESGGEDLTFSHYENTKHVPDLLTFAFDCRVTSRSPEAWPEHLPAPQFAAEAGAIGDVPIATELWLCAMGWILHHELSHIRFGHLEKITKDLEDEFAADDGATDWLLGGLTEDMTLAKRSLGVAIAVVVLAGIALHRNLNRTAGLRTHPPAGQRILRAMTHPSFAEDHLAQQFACIGVKVHLDHFGLQVPPGPFDSVSECLNAYCGSLVDWELGRK